MIPASSACAARIVNNLADLGNQFVDMVLGSRELTRNQEPRFMQWAPTA